MRVLQITTHMNIGGIANYILFLSSSLKEKGIDVLVASSGGNLEDELNRRGLSHERLDILTKFEFGPKVFKSAFGIARIVRNKKIDIVHAHTRVSQVVSFFASRLTGVPFVTTCHGFFKKRSRGIFDTWGTKVIAISDAVKSHLEDDLGVDKERISLIYSGVDINRFSKEYSADEIGEIKRKLGLGSGPVIGTIGRLSPVKGQRFFIEAMKDVISKRGDIEILIVGDGPEEGALKYLAKSLGIEGHIHFVRSDLDTHKFLSIMDIFVFPSLKEGLGIALLEALASGKACIASKIGGISDIIKDGFNGRLVNSGESAEISDAVRLLLDEPKLRLEMASRGRALVKERFSLDAMAGKVIKLYEEVAGK